MNKVFFIVGLAILSKGLFDFQDAFFGTTTFENVMSKDQYFEAGYYYFGFVFGSMAAYFGSPSVKAFSSFVGGACLIISAFIIIDTVSETKWQAEECAMLPTLDEVNDCFKEHGLVK